MAYVNMHALCSKDFGNNHVKKFKCDEAFNEFWSAINNTEIQFILKVCIR